MGRKNKNAIKGAWADDLADLFEVEETPEEKFRQEDIDKLLEEYPEMTRPIAGQIASGHYSIQEYVSKKNYQKKQDKLSKIENLLEKYPDMERDLAGQVVTGHLTLEHVLDLIKKKKDKEERRAYFNGRMKEIMDKYPGIKEGTAKKIVIGSITEEDYIASAEKKKLKEEKAKQFEEENQ